MNVNFFNRWLFVLAGAFAFIFVRFVSAQEAATHPGQSPELSFDIKVQTILKDFDGKSHWFDPRVVRVPANGARGPFEILLMQRAFMSASDYFSGYSILRSDDDGQSWSTPREIPSLGWRPEPGGVTRGINGFTSRWHAATGKVLAIGHTVRYVDGKLMKEPRPREVGYAVFDPSTGKWQDWRMLGLPGDDGFFSAGAGAAQWLEQADGSLLVPIYYKARDNRPTACYSATVLHCSFDGETIKYLKHGNELRLSTPRGFCEPSLTRCQARFYLTLRNDEKGFVSRSEDGLRWEEPIPWRFDDGQLLGSYNTQQHWATHSDGLFLVYTRRGASNDHVMRNRAPLFIGAVDPQRMVVIRATERIVIPERGAALGNFGVTAMSPCETWVTAAEEMAGWLKSHRGPADGSVFIGRVRWSRPNRDLTEPKVQP